MTTSSQHQQFSLYVQELRLSLRNNSGAYGFSVMITSVLAVLTSLHRTPGVPHIFLFLLGAVGSFAAIQLVATRGFRRSLAEQEKSTVVALGGSLGIVSISVAVGAAALVGLILPEMVAWPVGSFVGSTLYLLLTALEMSTARRIEEARNLTGKRKG